MGVLSQARTPFVRLQATKLHAAGERGCTAKGYFSSRRSGMGGVEAGVEGGIEIAWFVRHSVLFIFLLILEMVHEEGLACRSRINSSFSAR